MLGILDDCMRYLVSETGLAPPPANGVMLNALFCNCKTPPTQRSIKVDNKLYSRTRDIIYVIEILPLPQLHN